MGRIEFGTDGIRGPYGAWPIVPEVAGRVGRAAALLARSLGGDAVLIARDPRPSGASLAMAVAAGVAGAGGRALDAGVVPTAALQVGVADGLAASGVMITASHNEAADNGFKIVGAGGRKLDDAGVARVEAWLAEPASPGEGAEEVSAATRAAWAARLIERAGDLSPLAGRRIVVDCANGAALAVAEVIATLVPEVVLVGTSGPVNGGVGSEHLAHLQGHVRGAAGGFAVDGDADRCRLVDEAGREVSGDAVLWRLARDLGASELVATVMSNGALERHLPGVRIVRTPVGDRHVREAMDRGGAVVGGEESGHVILGDHPGGDGILTGLRALAAAFRAAPTVSEAFAEFVPLPRRLTKVRVRERGPLELLEPARAEGLARLGPHGRVFLRYSGTEPVLRVLVEGEGPVDEVSAAVTAAAQRVLA